MDADFPAAHSMDTDWFAVDRCGHVALFRSGEAGAVPEHAPVHMGPDGGDDALSEELFGTPPEDPADDAPDWPDAAAAGVIEYEHETENWISGPYARIGKPEKPARLEDLPESSEKKLGTFRFANLCFLETDRIQPIEHASCASWEPAWLALDGRTVRPIPGHEAEYRELYERRAELDPEGKIVMEPPAKDVAPPPPPAAPPAPPPPRGLGGWLKRLFGGR
jgi:hypothetical protein